MGKWLQLSMVKIFTTKCSNWECAMWLWEKIVQGLGWSMTCGKRSPIWSKAKQCINVPYSNSSHMKVMVRMANNETNSIMYWFWPTKPTQHIFLHRNLSITLTLLTSITSKKSVYETNYDYKIWVFSCYA